LVENADEMAKVFDRPWSISSLEGQSASRFGGSLAEVWRDVARCKPSAQRP